MSTATLAVPVDLETLIPIAIESLYNDVGFEFNLYLNLGQNKPPVLYRERSHPCQRTDLDQLRSRGIRFLYIPATDHELYLKYLREKLIANQNLSLTAYYSAIQELNRPIYLEALKSIQVDKLVDVATNYGRELDYLILRCDGDYLDLINIFGHDDCAFSHATNVCLYSMMLAKSLLGSNDELPAIATGALLHDIGKRKIPSTILGKPSYLTDYEMDLIRKHPQYAFEELSGRQDLEWPQLMMIYQHHERVDGHGYPVQLPRAQIHEWAQLRRREYF